MALRLQVGQDTSAIRPIVLRMTANEACLPLKLTAIAATPDLRINVWVLANARAVPMNYAEVAINQARLDWFNFGRNYDQLLKDAANEAEGNAFAVEYVMPATNSLPWFTVPPSARSQLDERETPPAFVQALASLGFQPTGAVLQLLRKHIPIPATVAARGVTEAMFYGEHRLVLSSDSAAFAPFNAAAAAADFDTDILVPWIPTGRLFEPERAPDPAGDVHLARGDDVRSAVRDEHVAARRRPATHGIAHVMCGDNGDPCASPVRMQMEDGRQVGYRPTSCMQYARGELDQMPAAEVAYQRGADGEGQISLDNRAAIMTAVRAHNSSIAFPQQGGCGCSCRRLPGHLATAVRGRRHRAVPPPPPPPPLTRVRRGPPCGGR